MKKKRRLTEDLIDDSHAILLVDDEKELLNVLQDVFTESGFKTFTATNPIAALDIIENEKVDLIISDILMPEMNGWEVHEKLKQNPEWKDIPIIFVTSVQDKTSRITGSVIADDFIDKPFETIELKEKIDKLVKEKN